MNERYRFSLIVGKADPPSVFATDAEQPRKSDVFNGGIVRSDIVGIDLRVIHVVDGVAIALLNYEHHDFPGQIVLRTTGSGILMELIPLLEVHMHFV
jgi:hypothetical protein